jgi:hypothetical protein
MQRRYTALRIVSAVYKIQAIGIFSLAALLAGLAIIGSLVGGTLLTRLDDGPSFLAAGGVLVAIVYGAVLVIAGTLLALPLYAFGQMIDLFIDMEMNTRTTNALLQQQMMRTAAPLPAPPPTPPPVEEAGQN